MTFNGRELVLYLGLLISSFLFCAGIAEVGVRLVAPPIYEVHPNGLWQLSKTLGCRLTPGFDGSQTSPEYHVRVTISQQGLRDREYGPKRPGTIRILALGDSFTFGFGVEGHEAYPKQLEQLLRTNHHGYRYEVINAGAPGYATNQEFQLLKEYGLTYQPDLILLGFFATNDIPDNTLPPDRFTIVDGYLYDKQGYEQAVQRRRQRPGRLPIPFKETLWAHSHAYRFFAERYHRWLSQSGLRAQQAEPQAPKSVPVANPVPQLVAVIDREVFEVTERLLLEIAQTTWQHQAAVALVLIPDIKQVESPDGPWRAGWAELTRLAAAHQIPVIDLAPAFLEANRAGRSQTLYFIDNKHWTPAGHRMAATLIYQALRQQRLIPAVTSDE